jgi:tRNA 2-selenouridine synthase
MALRSITGIDAASRLADFDTIVDARSPSEFAEDHLPGAVNWPVLDDAQRHVVGTMYKQQSPFDARKLGGALVARNIADHIERSVMDKPRDWKPLVYCWRGGQRSGSLALVLGQIGFDVQLVEGGYRAFRRAVLAALDELPRRFDYRVICGTTGSGKSRLLHALDAAGAQVLDLEGLANHRGSVLGLVPGQPQPGQKHFETRVWDRLRRFDPSRPVFIESESRQVGKLRVPEALMERMRASPCLRLELPLPARVALLLEDYDFFVRDAEAFCARLDALRALRGNETIEQWQAGARAGQWTDVVRDLLTLHYDPIYLRSMAGNFADFATAEPLTPPDGSPGSLAAVAATLIASDPAPPSQPAIAPVQQAGRQ